MLIIGIQIGLFTTFIMMNYSFVRKSSSMARNVLTMRHMRISMSTSKTSADHRVANIDFDEVHINFCTKNFQKSVVILEATATSQDILVNDALDEECAEKPWKEDPYGAVLWPSARLVSEHILSIFSKEELSRMTILELGTGTGLVSLSAALGGAKDVIATDYNPLTLSILEKAIEVNNIDKGCISTSLFDVKALEAQALPKCDLMLVADLLYEPATAVAVAKRVDEAIRIHNAKVIIGDSPNRPGRAHLIETLRDLLPERDVVFRTVPGQSVVGVRHDLISDKRSVGDKPRPLEMGLLELN